MQIHFLINKVQKQRGHGVQLCGHVLPEVNVQPPQEEKRVAVAHAALDRLGLGGQWPPGAVLGERLGLVDVDRPERLLTVRVYGNGDRVLRFGVYV